MVVPKNLPKAKVNVKEFITKDGKLDSNKFWKLSDAQIADLVGDAVHDIRTYIVRPTTYAKIEPSIRLLEALDKESPDLGLGRYVTLYKSMATDDGSALTKSYLDDLKQYDPDTFNLYLDNAGWETFTMPKDFDFKAYKAENRPKEAEPSTGVLTDKPLNNASPAETPSGALTNPPEKIPEVSKESTPVNVGRTIEEAEAEAYPPIDMERTKGNYASPTSPGVHIRVINAEGKPVDLTPEEITKFNSNTAFPSPEVIGEAMREAVVRNNTKLPEATPKEVTGTELNSAPASSELPKKVTVISNKPISDEEMLKLTYPKEGGVVGPLVGDTSLKPEDKPAFLTKGEKEAKTPAAEEASKTEAKTETATEVKTAEPSKGMFKKIGSWIRNHPKTSWGVGIPTVLGLVGGIGMSQADKIAEALKAGEDLDRNADEESELPEVFDNVNYRVWENYTPDYLNEEYVPGKIPSHIPQDRLDDKESPDITENKNQSQVINAPAPVNNATADYVRAAYNSYIPSDAGRAYQKAIYGDPLELDRMRLQQQQQQKWRDFVMRSGQSPAELVQRGLMPYDALQYV